MDRNKQQVHWSLYYCAVNQGTHHLLKCSKLLTRTVCLVNPQSGLLLQCEPTGTLAQEEHWKKKRNITQSSSIIKVDVTEPMKCLIAALTTLKGTWEDFVRDGKYTGFVSQQVYSQSRVPVGLCPFGFSVHSPLWHLSNTGDNTPSTPTKHYHPQVMLPNTVRLKGQACSLCLLVLPLPWWLRVPSQCRY